MGSVIVIWFQVYDGWGFGNEIIRRQTPEGGDGIDVPAKSRK